MKSFLLIDSGTVPMEWIDKNGHMNVVAYMTIFDAATDVLLEKCGVGREGADLTIVAARIMIDYRKELMQGEAWELWSAIIAAQPSYLTITHRLRSAGSQRAVCDIRGVPFSKRTRGTTMLNDALLDKVRERIVVGLTDRFELPLFLDTKEINVFT